MALVVDANMRLSIARDNGAESLVAALCSWSSSVTEDRGEAAQKTVAVLATNGMPHDYWTGY